MSIYEIPREADEAFAKYLGCFDQETGEQVVSDEEVAIALSEMEQVQNRRGELTEWALKKRANANARFVAIGAEIERISKQANREAKEMAKLDKMIEMLVPYREGFKPTSVGTFTVKYGTSYQTKVLDVSKLPAEMKREAVTLKADPAEYLEAIKAAGIPYESETVALSKPEIKKWLDSLPEEEREGYAEAARVETVRTIKIA